MREGGNHSAFCFLFFCCQSSGSKKKGQEEGKHGCSWMDENEWHWEVLGGLNKGFAPFGSVVK